MDKYEELEGKTVIVEGDEGIIVGCDKDVGLSIVDINDKNYYLFCLVGPSSPNWDEVCYNSCKELYYMLFDISLEMINDGYIFFNRLNIDRRVGTFFASSETCPFGQ